MTEYALQPLEERHRTAVVDIFNHFVESGFAAYPQEKVPYAFFDLLLKAAQSHPAVAVVGAGGAVVGFGLLRPFHPMRTFARSAEVTYFILPEHTGRGLGARLLAHLEGEAQTRGIDCLIADISELNLGSIRFHEKAGFSERGRLLRVGRKNGRDFGVVLMQKLL